MLGRSATQETGRNLVSLRLLTPVQLEAALMELGDPAPAELLSHLERRGLLTSFQKAKLDKGETTGYLLGRFKLLYLISAGSFARVFRGEDTSNGASVAIKILRGRHASDQAAIAQFRREAELTMALSHPNITRTLEVGYDKPSNQHYIAMEFVEGGNFREFLKIRKKIAPAETIRMGAEMVEGLRYALTKQMTHRDIKPTNILISATGQIKWVDFGLAGVVETKSSGPNTDQRTVGYAALERATGAPKGDVRSDIFFLGAVLYEMLAGEAAFPHPKGKDSAMIRIRLDQIRPLSEFPGIPEPVMRVVEKMLAFRPEQRYQSHDEVLRDLEALASESPPPSPVRAAALDSSASDETLTENGDSAEDGTARRVIVVHESQKVQQIIRDKLAERKYQVICTLDIGRAASLFLLKPAKCLIIDIDTIGADGMVQFSRLVDKARNKGLSCPAIFLANADQAAWVDDLGLPDLVTLQKPLTLGPVYRALKDLVKGSA